MGDTKELSTDVSESIDSKDIKLKICSIMEGGEDAFNNRAVRYGFKKWLSYKIIYDMGIIKISRIECMRYF